MISLQTDHAQLFNEAEKVEETLASEKISNHIDNIVNDKNLTNTNTIESNNYYFILLLFFI